MLTILHALAIALASAPGPAVRDLPAPPGELHGTVTGSGGGPVAHFTVNGIRFDDPDGRFKVLTPPTGEFRVVVRADGFAPNVFHVQGASGKKLEIPQIQLGGGEHVLGEVLDAETEMPVHDAKAGLADPAKLERLRFVRPERLSGVGLTGKGGWYEMLRTPRGLLVLVVHHPDYLPEFVPVNTRGALPTVYLHRGGAIGGSVLGGSGAPLAGARVVALSEEATDGAEATADRWGRFTLRKLRPGPYRIFAFSGKLATEAAQVAVVDGQVSEVSIQLGAPPRSGPATEMVMHAAAR
jgi:hypothetical protein